VPIPRHPAAAGARDCGRAATQPPAGTRIALPAARLRASGPSPPALCGQAGSPLWRPTCPMEPGRRSSRPRAVQQSCSTPPSRSAN